jgi:hypothetical protein
VIVVLCNFWLESFTSNEVYVFIPVFTVPFADTDSRDEHFEKHRQEFGVATPEDYERMADDFMAASMNMSLYECRRLNADRVRMHLINTHLGVVKRDGKLRTFCIPKANRIVAAGNATKYCQAECARIDL